ncbi:DNA repair metallo-beta-lactamase [Penicillium waksmanii]|uniref:DNA repair metallo-beta-lactamase n=1 Tax=Penicillium waksmanii TaxID=69791 RepID=UPI002546AA54|nr:DNA repair metallo-beta-lactamase [Penicillium waksmanii]KAJ6000525.1 DNA repair metallo-beta-lactamase [Penicillium waksmanii]
MSTFDGVLPVDYFRKSPARPAPLACFLSHVHSDHLQGLESFRAPFIYCSSATRELLLRLEKFPHRMNFQKGILESRRLHYKHLSKLLRPIPLHTPTDIELTPRRRIRVTLFDANHCPGAVMFLIEGDGKAIIYTGDIRAERWWIDSLVRHPILIPYTLGQKRLDKLYLDTTFAGNSNPFRTFPSKAQGLAELLQKVDAYSDDTVFYFRSWTFGYEEVWIALSAALNTQVHVDRYQMGLYQSLSRLSGSKATSEAPALCGYELGNKFIAGCLSGDQSGRVHSCEPGVSCPVARGSKTVYITPIVNRTSDGGEIPEVGAGGGLGDLYQVHELELPDKTALAALEQLCLQHIQDKDVLSQMQKAISKAFESRNKVLSLDLYGVKEEDEIPLERLVTKLGQSLSGEESLGSQSTEINLPSSIRFPYSRHSSYSELCELVAAFRPKDIHPCTVEKSSWSDNVSIERLFGHLCSGNDFSHDTHMRKILEDADNNDSRPRKRPRYENDIATQSTRSSSVDYEIQSNTADPTTDEYLKMQSTAQTTHDQCDPAASSQKQQEEEHISSQLSLPQLASSLQEQSTLPRNQLDGTDQVKAKRVEVRKAHRYLQEHCDLEKLQLGHVPSSWTSEEEGITNDEGNTQKSLQLITPAPFNTNTESLQPSNLDEDGEESPPQHNIHPTPIPDSQQTDTLSISISESLLAPSAENEEPSSEDPNEAREQRAQVVRDRMKARTRGRVDAFLAAMRDTYESWADMAMVSAGDNHTEEEMEL